MATTDLAKPLNATERKHLANHEATIDAGQKTFVAVGRALGFIRDQALHRNTHASFASYCKERWEFGSNYANKIIRASEAMSQVGTLVPTSCPSYHEPTNEGQVRPLTKLEKPEQKAEAWANACKAAESEGRQVTAKDVETEVAGWGLEPDDEPEEPLDVVSEPAEPTPEDRMKEANRELEGLARSIMAHAKEAMAIDNGHLTARSDTLNAQLKTAAGTIRACKAKGPCTYCDDGRGSGCDICCHTGWLTAVQVQSAPQ